MPNRDACSAPIRSPGLSGRALRRQRQRCFKERRSVQKPARRRQNADGASMHRGHPRIARVCHRGGRPHSDRYLLGKSTSVATPNRGEARVRVAGSVRVPGDKSLSHRALILGALANGRSRIRGLLDAEDIRSTWKALRSLGAPIDWSDGEAGVAGVGRRGLRAAERDLDCGNSGTTARLLAGAIAGHPLAARFVGDESLSRRPMTRIKEPLEAMGAAIDLERGDGLPMVVRGADLRPIVWRTPVASAQTKSAVLLAALTAGVRAEVREPAATRDHTERLLAAMGANVHVDSQTVVLDPVELLEPLEMDVPGDPSSAAFLIALGLLSNEGNLEIRDVALNERRTGFFEAVRHMGADIAWTVERDVAGEPVGTIRACPSSLRGITVEAN